MGQKVNPISFRLTTTNTWRSRWFDQKNYAHHLGEDYKLRGHIAAKLARAGISRTEIERTGRELVITIHTSKPGMVIGRGGAGIEELRRELQRLTASKALRVNVEEVRTPELDSALIAQNVAQSLERRIAFRRALRQAVERTMRAGAEGVKISVAGRLGGAEMSRRETAVRGSIPLHTLRADIDFGTALARTTYGVIGVKAWVYKGNIYEKEQE